MKEDQQKPLFPDNDLKKENQALREKIKEYKKLEEDLMAQRVYEKAKKRLVALITFSGIVLTIVGVIGIKSIINYMKNLITVKLESISEEQINKLVQEEGKKQVTFIVKEQQTKLEEVIIATAKQQINQINIASNPIRGSEKPAISLVTQRTLDLTSFMTPVRNQGHEGSTTGFAVAAALEYQIKKKFKKQVIISPRHIYYHAKVEAGYDPHSDTGASVRDAIKVIQTRGAVSEETWPYKPGDLESDPPKGIDTSKHYRISKSYPLSNLAEIKSAIQKNGPVVAGITLYNASISDKDVDKTGKIPDLVRVIK